MKPLISDVGLEQYGAVRSAYDKAKAVLQTENPNRDELSDLLDVLDRNHEGVDWLKDEEGKNYDGVYNGMLDRICLAYKVESKGIIFPHLGYIISGSRGLGILSVAEEIHKGGIFREVFERIKQNPEPKFSIKHHEMHSMMRGLSEFDVTYTVERLIPEFAERVKEYAEYRLKGKHLGKIEEIRATESLLLTMIPVH